MTVLIVLLALLALGLLAHLIRQASDPPGTADIDPEQEMKVAVELHRIRRNFDAAQIKSEQRRDAAQLRREIGKTLKDAGDG
ncbi:MAG TPA: hypothetical protein VF245_05890 [Solirubrobacterales bacterium]